MRCLALILMLLPTSLMAQRAAGLEGRIVDASTGEPISGTDVVVLGTRVGTYSDSAGAYRIDHPPVGTFDVRIAVPGYATTFLPHVSLRPNEMIQLDVAMVERQTSYRGVVELPRPNLNPDGSPTGHLSELEEELEIDTTVTLSGSVVDSRNDKRIAGATLTLGELVAISGDDGQYAVEGLVQGEYTVTVAAPGFRPVVYEDAAFYYDGPLNFFLSRSAPMDSVETAR